MQLLSVALNQAPGHILRHNIFGADGRRLLPKGRRLTEKDIHLLEEIGHVSVSVAVLEAGDVHEDLAARRLAELVVGSGLRQTKPVHSRVNVLAELDGIVRVNVEALQSINAIEGLTIATLHNTQLVRAKKRVATIKIIPFAVPEQAMIRAEKIAHTAGSLIRVDPLRPQTVGVILVGSAPRLEEMLLPAISARVSALGSHVTIAQRVDANEQQISHAIDTYAMTGVGLIIIAGETSIMDRDDVTPRAIRLAGGQIEHYGAPVEPGNLLLMAYLRDIPILGAPGCVRSSAPNVVDLLLPRLLAGERLGAQDIIALGHGGLL